MARTRRKWLLRLVVLSGIAAILGARQKKLDENDRAYPHVKVVAD